MRGKEFAWIGVAVVALANKLARKIHELSTAGLCFSL
jgi:hypothetical protein